MVSNTLSNRGGVTLTVKLPLSTPCKKCYIINGGIDANSRVLGVVNDATTPGSKVLFNEQAGVPNNIGQQWHIGKPDDTGYFQIKDVNSQRYLTAVSADKLTIESK